MPSPCCVPRCNGNYSTGPKVSVFAFPTESLLREKWIRAIHREDFTPTKYSKVCELHFPLKDIQTTREAYNERTGELIQVSLFNKRLVPGAVPSIFLEQPDYLSSTNCTAREDPEGRAQRKEMESLNFAIVESLKLEGETKKKCQFSSLQELCDKVTYDNKHWTMIPQENKVIFIHLAEHAVPKILQSCTIDSNLQANVFVGNIKVNLKNFSFPLSVSNINVVSNILDELKCTYCNFENQRDTTIQLICDMLSSLLDHTDIKLDKVNFLREQVSLLGSNKFANRYSSEMLIFSTLLYTIAPCAYKFLRQSGYLIVPHPNTINRLCTQYNLSPQFEVLDSNFLKYVKLKFAHLKDNDKWVNLLVDEVHLREYFEFKGGSISGMDYNAQNCASSAQVFMIKSIASQYKDVVHVLPVHTINGDSLHVIIRKIVLGLEDIGFRVICVITDNNSVNRSAMSQFVLPHKFQFCYPHPVDKTRPLFFVIDKVHILKCMRNNWLNQKNDGRCFFFPIFEEETCTDVNEKPTGENEKVVFRTARFNTIKDLHNLESSCLVKYGFKLNLKAIAPSSMEKQNVNLVLCIFNEFVAQALIELGDKHNLAHFTDTSEFLKIIIRWWEIVNVKTPNKGQRLNNIFQDPLTFKESDEKLFYLHKFLNWLDAWKGMNCSTGMFTRETHSALTLSTTAIIEIARYCSEELKMKYILPGKFQTDDLESRFGSYRRLAGCQYNISSQQLFECEKKLRIQSLLHLNIQGKEFDDIENVENLQEETNNNIKVFSDINVSEKDIKDSEEQLPTLMYLAGYCIFHALKKKNCISCKSNHQLDKTIHLTTEHSSYLKSLDRGGLRFPRKHILNAVLINYICIKKLSSEHEPHFIKLKNQRSVAASIAIRVLGEDATYYEDKCEEGHPFEQIIKKVIWCSSNILLNNYTKKKNDDIRQATSTKKNLAAKKAEIRKSKCKTSECTKAVEEQVCPNVANSKIDMSGSTSKKKVQNAKTIQKQTSVKIVSKRKSGNSSKPRAKKGKKQNEIDISDINWDDDMFADE